LEDIGLKRTDPPSTDASKDYDKLFGSETAHITKITD